MRTYNMELNFTGFFRNHLVLYTIDCLKENAVSMVLV